MILRHKKSLLCDDFPSSSAFFFRDTPRDKDLLLFIQDSLSPSEEKLWDVHFLPGHPASLFFAYAFFLHRLAADLIGFRGRVL